MRRGGGAAAVAERSASAEVVVLNVDQGVDRAAAAMDANDGWAGSPQPVTINGATIRAAAQTVRRVAETGDFIVRIGFVRSRTSNA